MKFHTSGAAGQKNGQFNREKNLKKANIEYRIMNVEYRRKAFCRFFYGTMIEKKAAKHR